MYSNKPLAILADKEPKRKHYCHTVSTHTNFSSLTKVFLPSFSTSFFIIARYVCVPAHHRHSDLVKDGRRKGQEETGQ